MKIIKHKDKWYLQSKTGYKEILLSTDIELTQDGVQAIDDEFLEWFVKNPSCESVDVFSSKWYLAGEQKEYLKIIIPKEEPKQETLEEVAFQRAVERRWHPNSLDTRRVGNEIIEAVKFGAKWQQEQGLSYSEGYNDAMMDCQKNMYSEEEVIAIVEKSRETGLTAEYLLLTEQFKKK
jgi:hypothetical protein